MIKREYQKMKKAFTMLELIFVLIIGSILLLLAIIGYNKLYIPTKAEAEVKKVQHVIGGVERVKNVFHGGSYLSVGATAIPSIQLLNDAMGGNTGTRDVSAWTYGCPVGANSTITVVTEIYQSVEEARLIVAEINSQLPPWVATVTGQTVTITRANSVCAL